eukprot:scaffold121708_cov19-Tisochrysis_lutea.AAC.1
MIGFYPLSGRGLLVISAPNAWSPSLSAAASPPTAPSLPLSGTTIRCALAKSLVVVAVALL